MDDFYTNTIAHDKSFGSVARVHDLALLEPTTREAVSSILTEALNMGHRMMVFETYRSVQRQAQLYKSGATKLMVVGVHHYGLACDIVKVNARNQPSWDGAFDFLGVLAKKHGLIWGGDWGEPYIHHSFVDGVHVQRCAVKDQEKLFSGEWYPAESYDPYE